MFFRAPGSAVHLAAARSGIINQWQQESKDKVISLLLTHLPLLKPGNIEAKVEYMKLLPKILAHSIEHNQHIEESRQLLSYALIHPATSLEDRSALAMWLNHLEDRTSGSFGNQNRGRSDSVDYGQTHYYHQRQNSDDKLNGWQNSRDSGICVSASSWQDKNLGCENGHLPLYSSSSVPTTINTIGTNTSTRIINQWQQESKDKVISLLLTHLPLLKPGNIEAKVEYMKLLPKILAHSIEHNQHIEESRQLLSYALIHPATSLEDRSALAMWLNHLEDRTSGSFGNQNRGRSDSVDYGQTHYYHQRQNSDDKLNGWQNSRDSGICVSASSWQDKNLGCENGHLPLYSSSSVPTTINTIGTNTSTNPFKPIRLHMPLDKSTLSHPLVAQISHTQISRPSLLYIVSSFLVTRSSSSQLFISPTSDKCHICKSFKARIKKERIIHLKALLMESALTLVPEQQSDSALSTAASMRSAPPAASMSQHPSPSTAPGKKPLKTGRGRSPTPRKGQERAAGEPRPVPGSSTPPLGSQSSSQVKRCSPSHALPTSLDSGAGPRQLQVPLTPEALQVAQDILMILVPPSPAPAVPQSWGKPVLGPMSVPTSAVLISIKRDVPPAIARLKPLPQDWRVDSVEPSSVPTPGAPIEELEMYLACRLVQTL
ncbi:Protein Smaug like protein 1 [Chelonia mydas]|uniref:Protein Smaug like protein 1 n=1 Tax=Chelonia mydas TaxID=8469 RepID=M7BM51_CHEMY|nr:Protein Smaug like protein 1 [Chelonia mydas]